MWDGISSWPRGHTFGAEPSRRFLAEQRPAALRPQAEQRLLDSLDGLCSRSVVEACLRDLADTDQSLSRQISELLELMRQYGPEPVAWLSPSRWQHAISAPTRRRAV